MIRADDAAWEVIRGSQELCDGGEYVRFPIEA